MAGALLGCEEKTMIGIEHGLGVSQQAIRPRHYTGSSLKPRFTVPTPSILLMGSFLLKYDE